MSRSLAIVFLVACLGTSVRARAEEVAETADGGVPAAEERWGGERVLGGHIFEYPTLTESSFLASTLAFQVLTTFNASRTLSANDDTTVSVQQVAPLLDFDLTLHIADPVAIFFGLTGAAASGISTSSLVLKGESLSYGANGGVIVRLLRDEKGATQISVRAGGFYASGTTINLRTLVDILQGNSGITIDDIVNGTLGDALLTPFKSYGGNVGGAMAHAFARWLSLQASLALRMSGVESNPYVVADQARHSETQFLITPIGAFDLTFDGNQFHVPLALSFEYRLGINFNNANSTTTTTWSNAFDLGLFYSGRSDVQAGIVFVAFIGVPPLGLLGAGNPGTSQNGFGSVLTLRYVW